MKADKMTMKIKENMVKEIFKIDFSNYILTLFSFTSGKKCVNIIKHL